MNLVLSIDPAYYSLQYIAIGIIFGCIWYGLIFFWIFSLYKLHHLNYTYIWKITLLAAALQILAGWAYWNWPLYNGDSINYFYNLDHFYNPDYGFQLGNITGSALAVLSMRILNSFLFYNSALAAFIFSSGLGLLSSFYYLLTFKLIAEKQNISFGHLHHVKYLIFPTVLIFLWPSKLYFSCGLAKDSMSFCGLSIFFYYWTLYHYKKTLHYLLIAGSVFAFLFMLRPYLFLILFGAVMATYFFSGKIKGYKRVMLGIVFIGLFFIVGGVLQKFGRGIALSLSDISQLALQQQQYQNIGTSIPLATTNNNYVLLFLPYTMLANAFLPIFYPVSNVMGILASCENVLLVWLAWYWLKNRKLVIGDAQVILSFFNWFFFFGILYLGLINTNLGLAMREKLMFLPVFLISFGIVYLAKNKQKL